MNESTVSYQIEVCPVCEDALCLRLLGDMSPVLPSLVRGIQDRIIQAFGSAIVDVVASYQSLLIYYYLPSANLYEQRGTIKEIACEVVRQFSWDERSLADRRMVEIPVCYDREFGLDLESMSAATHLSVHEIVEIHSSTDYQVYAVGFTPGFAYLGEVDDRIACKRLDTPRLKIPAGSVGIADRQTGVYPLESPGGWSILGRTPMSLFNAESVSPCILNIGDRVRFLQISPKEFVEMEREVAVLI